MLSIYREAWKWLDDKSFHLKKGPGRFGRPRNDIHKRKGPGGFRVCKGKDPEIISIKGKAQKTGLLTVADSEQPYLHQFLTYLLRFFCILFPMIKECFSGHLDIRS